MTARGSRDGRRIGGTAYRRSRERQVPKSWIHQLLLQTEANSSLPFRGGCWPAAAESVRFEASEHEDRRTSCAGATEVRGRASDSAST